METRSIAVGSSDRRAIVFILILLSTACLYGLSLGLNAACLVHNVIFRIEWNGFFKEADKACLFTPAKFGGSPPRRFFGFGSVPWMSNDEMAG